MKRRMMGEKSLIEVYEEITGTRNWIVPPGCKSVDAFVVGGGGNGGSGSPIGSGAGGNGGEVKTYTGIQIMPGSSIYVEVGMVNGNSSFGSYTARGAAGSRGGSSLGQVLEHGHNGSDGVYAFNNSSRFPCKYGAGGGGGAAFSWGPASERCYGGSGGNYGAGRGGDSYQYAKAPKGGDAAWYGAGGGGGGKSDNSSDTGGQGAGYQGIVILHYWKYK